MMYSEIVLPTGVNPLKMLDMSCLLRFLPLRFCSRNSTNHTFRPVPTSQMLSELLDTLYLLRITPYIPDDFHGFTTDHVMEEDDYLIA